MLARSPGICSNGHAKIQTAHSEQNTQHSPFKELQRHESVPLILRVEDDLVLASLSRSVLEWRMQAMRRIAFCPVLDNVPP
jgi:hypothetical protein